MTKQKRVRVMQVLYSGLGGHGSVFTSLIEGDKEQKVDNSALFYGIEPLKPEYIETCTRYGVPYSYIHKGSGVGPWGEVYRQFVLAKPDIILLHSLNLLPVALRYTALHKCRLIVVEHNALTFKSKSEWAMSYMAMLFAPQVVLLTPDYASQLRQHLGLFYRKGKVTVIPNGIDTGNFAPAPLPAPRTEIVISMQARFSASKDQRALVEAFAELLQQYKGEMPLRLRLAGDGPGLAPAQEAAQGLGITHAVDFMGMIPEEEVVKLLQTTDVYVHYSLGDTMSTAVMQALSVQLPVVATNITGINNMVSHGINGLLFEPGDKQALVESILSLLLHAEKRQKLAQNARTYALGHLSHEQMFSSYYKLYVS